MVPHITPDTRPQLGRPWPRLCYRRIWIHLLRPTWPTLSFAINYCNVRGIMSMKWVR